MKRKLLIVIVLALCVSSIGYSQYVEDTITAHRTESAPLIDGDIDPEWDNTEFVAMQDWGDEGPPDEADFKAEFKMLWDDDYVYFLGVIVDDLVADQDNAVAASAPDWECDSWEFYISPPNTKLPNFDDMTQIRFAYANAGNADASSNVTAGWSPSGFMGDVNFATAARKLSDDGWNLEVKFELAAFAATVEDIDAYAMGDILAWNVTVSDRDDAGARDDIGNHCISTQWDQADTLSILKLGAAYVAGIEDASVAPSIRFYPNPVAQELHISSDVEIEKVEIFNSVGAMVLRSNHAKEVINVESLQTGL